jgi:ATP-binding cassette subfamily F protein uup
MEENVLAAETRVSEARGRVEDPSIATDAAALQEHAQALDEAQREVDRLYERWAELESKAT